MSRRTTKLTVCLFAIAAITCLSAACSEIQKPQPEPFYAETAPPAKQEFRWSNGKLPKSFDPARAAAAPDTDVVRALFEGLTELDPRTLGAVPAAAEKWTASDDLRVWTFQLRKNAHWSNGRRVTAYDFVISWKRLLALGEKTAHRELFQNIVGFQAAKPVPITEPRELTNIGPGVDDKAATSPANTATRTTAEQHAPQEPVNAAEKKPAARNSPAGVEAVDDLTLKVTLVAPDPDFPNLVAEAVFRPIYGDGAEFAEDLLDNGVVTNGGFHVVLVDKNGVTLERSETYWNKAAIKLDRVRFVAKDTAESALEAYKKGEVDALTNAEFEPLALKLLSPFEDFRQSTFSAVNIYKFDVTRPPFNDRRVREALAISIDRERLSTIEMEGAVEPANSFRPVAGDTASQITFDPAKAKTLLETAGFPNGAGVAPLKLVINRNDTQMRIARAVAKMWKQNLNLDTDITVKEASEMEAVESSHEFDLVRQGIVLPTPDEFVSLAAIFGVPKGATATDAAKKTSESGKPPEKGDKGGPSEPPVERPLEKTKPVTITEEDALYELNAIPLYFPRSYSLVKPYVHGFEINGLNAVYLPAVSIDNNWQPNALRRES